MYCETTAYSIIAAYGMLISLEFVSDFVEIAAERKDRKLGEA
jgi:hypothetical protein